MSILEGYTLCIIEHSNDEYSIHGLWQEPWDKHQRDFKHYPLEESTLRSILNELHQKWYSGRRNTSHPDLNFWRHEFDHHGAIIEHVKENGQLKEDELDYFSTVLDLFDQAVRKGSSFIESFERHSTPYGTEFRIPLDKDMHFIRLKILSSVHMKQSTN